MVQLGAPGSEQEARDARSALREALARDPGYSAAWRALGKALEDADDGATTAGGRLLCLDCYAEWDTDAPLVRHGRACGCDRCVAAADDARKARGEEGR